MLCNNDKATGEHNKRPVYTVDIRFVVTSRGFATGRLHQIHQSYLQVLYLITGSGHEPSSTYAY